MRYVLWKNEDCSLYSRGWWGSYKICNLNLAHIGYIFQIFGHMCGTLAPPIVRIIIVQHDTMRYNIYKEKVLIYEMCKIFSKTTPC